MHYFPFRKKNYIYTVGTKNKVRLIYFHQPSQNLLHLPALGKLIHQLVQVPDFPDQRVFDVLDPVPTDEAGNQVRVRVQGSVLKKLLEGHFFADLFLHLVVIEAGQPYYDLMQFFFGPAFLLYFRQV